MVHQYAKWDLWFHSEVEAYLIQLSEACWLPSSLLQSPLQHAIEFAPNKALILHFVTIIGVKLVFLSLKPLVDPSLIIQVLVVFFFPVHLVLFSIVLISVSRLPIKQVYFSLPLLQGVSIQLLLPIFYALLLQLIFYFLLPQQNASILPLQLIFFIQLLQLISFILLPLPISFIQPPQLISSFQLLQPNVFSLLLLFRGVHALPLIPLNAFSLRQLPTLILNAQPLIFSVLLPLLLDVFSLPLQQVFFSLMLLSPLVPYVISLTPISPSLISPFLISPSLIFLPPIF
jgi:hypothetical protein